MSNTAIVLAAGSGTRMKLNQNKIFLKIGGKTVIERSVEAMLEVESIDRVIVACKQSEMDLLSSLINDKRVSFCIGGSTRQQSVLNAVKLIDSADLVVIHDGARPLVTKKSIESVIDKAMECGAAATGVWVKDTIKVVNDDMKIISTPNRSTLVAIQTPQVFRFDTYKEAAKLAIEQGKDLTDDCQLVENMGISVFAVEGDYDNIKITTPQDICVAESILNRTNHK